MKFVTLQKVYKKLCQNSYTTPRVGQEEAEMEVGKGTRRGVWETQESVHNRTYPSNPRH